MIVAAEIILSGEDYVSKKALKRFRRVIILSYVHILVYIFLIVMFQLKSFWNLSHIKSLK